MSLKKIKTDLRKLGDKKKAKILQGFFKTGPGDYAEGDIFIGIKVPVLRGVAKSYGDLPVDHILPLLRSPIHEERFLALLILMSQYSRANAAEKENIYKTYLSNTKFINNWDLVDVTAKRIVGAFLKDKDRSPLYALARSGSLWERRIAILSTFHFIEYNDFKDALNIAEILIDDPHDLIHKAVGWMLREVGKRNISQEERFLRSHCRTMPRTMLRYAIEKFPERKRQSYLKSALY